MIRCSEWARSLAEPLAGTAPVARAWVAVEQPGPWGRQAVVDSHLDREVAQAVADSVVDLPVTVVLVREVGHHADDHAVERPRHVWVAWTGAEPWLQHHVVRTPAELLSLDVGAVAEGRRPEGFGAPDPERLLLVCTNARRDQCCAIVGRPVAAALAAASPGRVWESSHLGGHRFTPTIMSLPDGFVYGGPDGPSLGLAACRGRSHLGRAAQAAELAVLDAWGVERPRALDVRRTDDRWLVSDPVTPGLAPVEVEVAEVELEPPRPESCGKDDVSPVAMVATLAAAR